MKNKEGRAFEKDPNFQAIIDMRGFDEAAKISGLVVPTIDDYKDMMKRNLNR